jgi:hypothetical protein
LLPLSFLAILPPAAYAAPRQNDNVLFVQPSAIHFDGKEPGSCRVKASVREVWLGSTFHPGQVLTLSVPCGHPQPFLERLPANADHVPGLIDVDVLYGLSAAAVHVDNAGVLIWKPIQTERKLGVGGYMVLDGVGLPIKPTGL